MATINDIMEQFDLIAGDIADYFKRFEHFLIIHKVVEDRHKVASLITFIGPNCFTVLKSLLAPEAASTKTYDELKTVLVNHFGEHGSVIIERFNFYKKNQAVGESIKEYVMALTKLSRTCNFAAFLDEALRDKFVCGMYDEATQKRLLQEKNLSFERACLLALSMETALVQSNEIKVPLDIQAVKHYRKKGTIIKCNDCGRWHAAGECKVKNWDCLNCGKTGHITKMCRTPNPLNTSKLNAFHEHHKCSCEEPNHTGLFVNLYINSVSVKALVDSGACVTVISEAAKNEYFPSEALSISSSTLKSVSGDLLEVIGECTVDVYLKGKNHILSLVCFKSNKQFEVLIGRNWLDILVPAWREYFSIHLEINHNFTQSIKPEVKLITSLKNKFSNIFENNDSCISNFVVNIELKSNAVPVFKKAYSVPYAVRELVEAELKSMVNRGILEAVDYSKWASPIVVVQKKDGSIRICNDFKNTINPYVEVSSYSLPNAEDIFASLSGGKIFAKIDLKGAFQQLRIGHESLEYFTINTHIGLFRYRVLTFGMSAAPAYFQKVMDAILKGLVGVVCYFDDILVSEISVEQCIDKCFEVFKRLSMYNVKINIEKCSFLHTTVNYLGHTIDELGIHPTDEKLIAITNAPNPQNVQQVRSFLGLLNFYRRFLPMLSTELRPLYDLLKKDNNFQWTADCDSAFKKGKQLLLRNNILVPYDSSKHSTVICDASPYGVGSALVQKFNRINRPVMFASTMLTETEQKYSHLEKKAMAIIFGVKKFHKYLYGRKFTLVTDYQPVQMILGSKKNIPPLAFSRIQRWAITLSTYNYKLVLKKRQLLAVPDALSRLPLPQQSNFKLDDNVVAFNENQEISIDYCKIASCTANDENLSKVKIFVLHGWSKSCNLTDLKPYYNRLLELSVERECLLWGMRVIIPKSCQQQVLSLLHEQHTGMVRMKWLARSLCWWPNIDAEIEEWCQNCMPCQSNRKIELQYKSTWSKSLCNWHRIHADFFHKFGKFFLIIVDNHSKWMEIKIMDTTSAHHVIDELRQIFSTFGLPMEFVSDNRPPFNSRELMQFFKRNRINALRSPFYHPQSNGLAECAVQTAKIVLSKETQVAGISKCCIQKLIDDFLLKYRTTPCTVSGISPAKLILNTNPRTRFEKSKPPETFEHQHTQKEQLSETKIFTVGEHIWVKLSKVDQWTPAKICKIIGSGQNRLYLISINGIIKKAHLDQLRKSKCDIFHNSRETSDSWMNGEEIPILEEVKFKKR